MTSELQPLALALAFGVGASLGLLGGGGSILTLPVLLYAVGMPPKQAVATSLLVVASASFAAMLAHAREGRVAWRSAGTFAAASTVTAYLAGRVADALSGPWLVLGFALVMVASGVAMLHSGPAREPAVPSHRKVFAAGVGVGSLTGLVGAGGGFLIVPALTMFAGLELSRALGTSLLIISLNSLAGFAGYLGHAQIEWHTAAGVTLAATLGGWLGSKLAGRIEPAQLRRGFALVVLTMGVYTASRQMPPIALTKVLHDPRSTHLAAAGLGALMTYLTIHLRARVGRRSAH